MSTGQRKFARKFRMKRLTLFFSGNVWNKSFKENFYSTFARRTWQESKMKQSLRPLDCWDCGFESRWGHGCLLCVLCRLRPLWRADHSFGGFIPVVCVCVYLRACVCVRFCDLTTSTMRSPRPVAPQTRKGRKYTTLELWHLFEGVFTMFKKLWFNDLYRAILQFLTVVFFPHLYAPFQNI